MNTISIHMLRKFLLTILVALLIPTTVSAAQTLTYTDHEPLGGMRTRFIKEVFFSAIENESQGRLTIEDHWGGELASGYDALRMVGKGPSVDMAIVVPEYSSKNLPLHQIFKSFPMGPTGDKQLSFYRHVYTEVPNFPEELKKENVVNILFTTGFPLAFFSSKELNTLEDIKGEKWRSASFWHQGFLRNAGAESVTIPWGEEVYKSLRNGSLDGLMVNVDSGYDLKAQTVAPNVLVSKDLWLGHVYLLVMNKDTWDGLAQEDKDAIFRAAEVAYKALGPVMDSSFDVLIDKMKTDGVNVRILEPSELEQWKTTTRYEEVQATWVKEQDAKGVKDTGPVLEKVRTIMNDVMK